MSPQDVLPTIAEIAIGLAGFSGLVAAFGRRPVQDWQDDQKARIVFLVILSFTIIVTALLPPALSGFSESPAVIWGAPMIGCSSVALASLVYWTYLARKHDFKLQFPRASMLTLSLTSLLQVVVLLSGLGLIVPYSPGLFVLGLLAILVFLANMFLALLHMKWRE